MVVIVELNFSIVFYCFPLVFCFIITLIYSSLNILYRQATSGGCCLRMPRRKDRDETYKARKPHSRDNREPYDFSAKDENLSYSEDKSMILTECYITLSDTPLDNTVIKIVRSMVFGPSS